MVNLNPFAKKPEVPKTLQERLEELNQHFYTDSFFRDSLKNIDDHTAIFTNEEIEKLTIDGVPLSELRKSLLRACMARKKYLMHHVPHANAIDNHKFGKGMEAAIDLLHDDVIRILSGSTDEAVISEVMEDFSAVDILVGYSFPSKRTSLNKGVSVQGPPAQGNPWQSPMLDEDMKGAMMEMMRQRAEKGK